jgi:RecA-family ATPase
LNALAIAADGTVILVSHPSLTGIATGTGLSGSTQWHNAVRSRFYLRGIKGNGSDDDGEPKGGLRELAFMKNNYGPETESIVLKYEYGLYIPVEGATVDEATKQQRAEEIYLEVLLLLIAQNQHPGPKKKGSNYAPRMISEHPKAKGFSLRDMETAQQRLLDDGRIRIVTEGFKSKKADYIRPGDGRL